MANFLDSVLHALLVVDDVYVDVTKSTGTRRVDRERERLPGHSSVEVMQLHAMRVEDEAGERTALDVLALVRDSDAPLAYLVRLERRRVHAVIRLADRTA